MIEVPQPPPGPPDEVRGFAACLAAILEVEIDEVPCPAGGDPWLAWREWLASRRQELIPVPDPGSYSRPGFWIARAGGGPVLMFGTPAGVAWDPFGRGSLEGAPEEGWVVAPLDPATPAGEPWPAAVETGRIEAIVLAEAAASPGGLVESARALAGRGLEGDRYAAGAGTFSGPGTGRSLTLIEAEALEQLELPGGERVGFADARRNVVTRGIALNPLVGRRFTVGEVECVGRRLCEPCAHLERLTAPGVLRGLVHRGGLRADILSNGEIRVGDAVRPLGDPPPSVTERPGP